MIAALLLAVQTRIASSARISHESDPHPISHADRLWARGCMRPQGDHVPGALVTGYNRLDGQVCTCPEGYGHVGMAYSGVHNPHKGFVRGNSSGIGSRDVDDGRVVALPLASCLRALKQWPKRLTTCWLTAALWVLPTALTLSKDGSLMFGPV